MPDREKVLAVVREWVTKAENDLKNAAHMQVLRLCERLIGEEDEAVA